MKTTAKLTSLLLAMLMMAAAAITTNQMLFKNDFSSKAKAETLNEESLSNTAEGECEINTGELSDAIGYAGKTPLKITIQEGKVTEIEFLENKETPRFMRRAEVIADSWKGKSVKDALETKVDAVSGATYTSNAIISNAHAGFAHYLDQENKSTIEVPISIWAAFAVTLAACILPLFVRNRWYRNVQYIANIIVLGFWSGQFLDYSNMLKYISYGIELPIGLTAIAMLTAAFVYPLFGKSQHYCNYICPLGSAQIIASQLCGFKLKLGKKTVATLEWFRRILWAFLMVTLWCDVATEWMDFELFQIFVPESASFVIITAAIAFVLLSAVVARPYCRFVCPTGSLFKRSENIG